MRARWYRLAWGVGGLTTSLVTLATIFGSGGQEISSQPIRLAGLNAPSDAVHFDVTRSGCFSISRHSLRYQPYPAPHILVSEVPGSSGPSWNLIRPLYSAFKHPVATVTMTHRETVGLDRLLQFFREQRPGGCTRRDEVTVSQYIHGWKLRSESYFDSTCQGDLLADADPRDLQALGEKSNPIIALDRVIALAEAAEQRGQSRTAYAPLRRQETRAYQELQYRPHTLQLPAVLP